MTNQSNTLFNNPFFKGSIDNNGYTINLNPDLYGNLFTLDGAFSLRYPTGEKGSVGADVLIPKDSGIGGFPFKNSRNYLPATLELSEQIHKRELNPGLIYDGGYLSELNIAYLESFKKISEFEVPAIHKAKKNLLIKLTDIVLGEEDIEPTNILRPMFLTNNDQFKPAIDYSKFRLIPIITKEV